MATNVQEAFDAWYEPPEPGDFVSREATARSAFNAGYRAALAKPASAPAGGVREAIEAIGKWHMDQEPNTGAMSESLARDLMERWHQQGRAVQQCQHILRALSSSAGPAEPVAWGSKAALSMISKGVHATIHPYPPPNDPIALYEHPAPATVDNSPILPDRSKADQAVWDILARDLSSDVKRERAIKELRTIVAGYMGRLAPKKGDGPPDVMQLDEYDGGSLS